MSADEVKLPPYRGQFMVRAAGILLLTICFLMLILGLTVLGERLHGPGFALYWSWCFLTTMAAMLTALLDMLMIRRTSKQTQRKLIQEQLLSHPPAGKD